MTEPDDHQLIRELDAYLDAAPRPDADPIETGAFTVFVSRTPWRYYARPSRTHAEPITATDLRELERVCAAQGVDLEIEWIHETHPELAGVAAAYELQVEAHVLMVLDSGDAVGVPLAHPHSTRNPLRVADADPTALRSGRAVAHVAFTSGGTMTGPAGAAERDAALARLPDDQFDHLQDRVRRGLTITAVAQTAAGVVAVGSYQPVGVIAEIVGVATLPNARRQGWGGAVTALLTQHARAHGVRTILLSAQNDEVARVYGRVGFRSVGTTHAAQRPSSS